MGYNLQDHNFDDGTGDYIIRGVDGSTEGGKFVTNMPQRQQMRADDYGTIAFFNCLDIPNAAGMQYAFPDIQTMPSIPFNHVPGIALSFWDEFGVLLQVNFYSNVPNQGGAEKLTNMKDVSDQLIYFGHGLANMRIQETDQVVLSVANQDLRYDIGNTEKKVSAYILRGTLVTMITYQDV